LEELVKKGIREENKNGWKELIPQNGPQMVVTYNPIRRVIIKRSSTLNQVMNNPKPG